MNNTLLLAICIIACLVIGFLGSFFTVTGPDSWYASIKKPSFNPPNWIFGPVWTLLYILMGISLFLILKQGLATPMVKTAVLIFGAQLVLNLLWSGLFFGLQSPLFAAMEIVLLWVFILLTILYFYPLSKPAAFLLVPYILWVSFATVLNFSIMILN